MGLQRDELIYWVLFLIKPFPTKEYLMISVIDINITNRFSIKKYCLPFSLIFCTGINAKILEECHDASKYFI